MREIKFRLWDKELKQWYKPVYEAYKEELDDIVINPFNGTLSRRTIEEGQQYFTHESGGFPDRYFINQFTGLKDKNGKDIYEGDIIQVNDDWEKYGWMSGEVREIYFLDGGFRLKPKSDTVSRRISGNGAWLEDGNDVEVIGNIYENPELINL